MSLITSEFLKKKAREISYALNRVSFYIKREDLRNRLERLSFEFLENAAVAGEDASDKSSLIKVFKNISALDVLVRIGHSLYEIETVNSNILIRELDSFNSAIRQLAEENSAIGNNSEFGKLNLESIFSMPPAIVRQPAEKQSHSEGLPQAKAFAMTEREIATPCIMGLDRAKEINSINDSNTQTSEPKDFANIDNEKEIVERAYSKDTNGITQQVRDESGNRTIRQNLISEKIRQSGKANVRELINQFPGVSERTLRYDLQRLCDQGVVEKIGSSGPGTSYVPRN